jgi:aryl-alcohol dehydrogenase (NADP+)
MAAPHEPALDRYHRQMLLPDIGEGGQRRLLASSALIVGCGALGCVAADALVRAGKVRAIGLSNYTPERVTEYVSVARANGWAVPVAVQPHYNLVFRAEFETSMAAVCAEFDLGVAPYFALGAGLLTGKYASADDMNGHVRAGAAGMYASDQAWEVVGAVREIAAGNGVAPATVALAWLRDQPSVTAPIASARVVEQLPALMAAAAFQLPFDDAARLTQLSAGL